MPLLRRRAAASDAEMRRHSFFPVDSNTLNPILDTELPDGRASEQMPRRPSPGDFPSNAAEPGTMTSLPMLVRPATDYPAALQRSGSPPIQEETSKHRRFSMLRFRHASDSQLSTRSRLQAQSSIAEDAPPIPQRKYFFPFDIITTAPTMDFNGGRPMKKKSRVRLPGRTKSTAVNNNRAKQQEQPPSQPEDTSDIEMLSKKERRKTMSESGPSNKSRVTFDEPNRPMTHGNGGSPPAYGDEASSALALPVNRLSESSRSDASSGEHGVYATTTTTTHTVQTTTTFFRLPRRKKPAPLFDLSHLPQKSAQNDASNSLSVTRYPTAPSPDSARAITPKSSDDLTPQGSHSPFPPSPTHTPSSPTALMKTSSGLGRPNTPLLRQGSTASSSRSSPTRSRLTLRGRSSTLSSLRNAPNEDSLPTPTLPSTRTSTSTGRKSFGDLFNLTARLRQNPEPGNSSGPTTPASNTSKNNSMQLNREEAIILPERYDDDTPANYLVRLEEAVSRGVVASVLSKGTDSFSQAVLRSYMRGFGFFGDPMDMAIRKLLMEVELPKETQQIDRCLQGFANRYHECNPGIYASPDQAYFIAFSLLILHTDVFNKNNKHKMTKADYIKNTHGEGIFDEILECFYDNISYTPFIHVEDDLDINGERIIPHKMKKKSKMLRGGGDPNKRPSKEPVDPYTLILDSKLDTLRPNLKDVMHLDEHYSYLGTAPCLNLQNLQKTFFKTGVLQIVSARSRPDAFMSEKTVTNPEEAQAGIVDIKITKVGLLWRKDAKKKKTRSPWQEWGAILTGAQLYFFRNTAWIKSLMHQHETHIKQGHDGTPVIFKPPLEQFKPDALMSTDDAVALVDSTYKKHKHAFVFVRHGGFEETFLADNEDEMNDWLAKLNYAAAFRTAGVRMRGVVGGNYEGQRNRGIRRLDSANDSTKFIQTPSGEVSIVSGKIDNKMQDDILAARRQIMLQKVVEAEEKLTVAVKQLDSQLRNARHLQILAPVQQKTREQVLSAAARMAAQLKWGRMEIWRLKCHRDILILDLDEEKNMEGDLAQKTDSNGDTPMSARSALNRLQSKASSLAPQGTPKSPTLDSMTRPSTSGPSLSSSADRENTMDDIFQAAPYSMHKAQASWELPPLAINEQATRKPSVSSVVPPSPSLATTPSRSSLNQAPTLSSKPSDPNLDAAEQSVLEQAGLVDSDMASEEKEQSADKDKFGKGKIRRSIHQTLREAHVPSHHRSRRGRDSNSSAGMSDEGTTDDILSRGSGSFVVHGKKASVITFGTELQSMSPEERIRLRKQPHKEDSEATSPATIDDDFHSILAEPIEFHQRHNSAASTSTATARSFRELHRKYSSQHSDRPPNLAVTVDDDDEAAVSMSDGRRSPLPPVEDENEDEDSSSNDRTKFYTPDPSPRVAEFDEHSLVEPNLQHDIEHIDSNERLPSPTLQTVGA
ncbi:uncharacterized protein EAE97_008195 [Botrytis byssoidea]|uniref:SEC7 domain-containing protein n=1 Tax=Botrytis byssoidea TaxID=139641 RepID=A0A9P5IIN3_9HELO|nr:uncharacterized protein EAE97_008195 [Botrytis byssoidea]KAF7935288.1 hypothetical protein EAE97_008195 [Botrytis byssoidea]